MNNNYNMNGWFQNQYVNMIAKGFCLSNDEQLEQTKQFLDLKSEHKALKAIQKYFLEVEGRDPSYDELKFIDCIAISEPRKPGNHLLTELSSDETYIGESYDDLKEKLSALGKKPPYSFSDIFYAGEITVNAFAERKNNAPAYMYSGNSALLKASVSGNSLTSLIQSKPHGSCAVVPIGQEVQNTEPIENSDSIIFVSSMSEQTSGERFIPMLSGLLINFRSKIQVKSATATENGNLLDAVLSSVPGAFINFTALPGMIYNSNAAMLLDSFHDSAIVIVSSKNTNEFLMAARSYGFSALVFGHPNLTSKLIISTGAGHPISLSTGFLKSMSKYACLQVNVKKPSHLDSVSSNDFTVMGFSQSFYASYVAKISSLLVTNAKRNCHSYRDALEVVIESVCRLISCGVNIKDITASFEATVNTLADSETLGESLSLLLGLYRAETELSIHSFGSSCRLSYTPSLSVTLSAPLPKQTIPNTFVAKGSRVYLLSPRKDENGITNFMDLKALFNYIEELKGKGLILSARAVNGTDVIGSAAAMQTDLIRLNPEAKIAGSAVGAFIIESKNELEGTFLGFTE